MLPIGLCAQLACIWEATARKPGNVHRFRDFNDSNYVDFLASAAAIAPVMEKASEQRVGQTILDAVQATRQVVKNNTNLGIILLLAPLAALPREQELGPRLLELLSSLDIEDARLTYEAIRLASPAGLGKTTEEDVATEPTRGLREVMELAADRDLVARQYAKGFLEPLGFGLTVLPHALSRAQCLEQVIVECHLLLMALQPDSLITRKRGLAEAKESQQFAEKVLEAGWPKNPTSWHCFHELDTWLSAEGHSRNPGATADLVAASLFVALRENTISLPLTIPWSVGWNHG